MGKEVYLQHPPLEFRLQSEDAQPSPGGESSVMLSVAPWTIWMLLELCFGQKECEDGGLRHKQSRQAQDREHKGFGYEMYIS